MHRTVTGGLVKRLLQRLVKVFDAWTYGDGGGGILRRGGREFEDLRAGLDAQSGADTGVGEDGDVGDPGHGRLLLGGSLTEVISICTLSDRPDGGGEANGTLGGFLHVVGARGIASY
jgi:hypothetical protein